MVCVVCGALGVWCGVWSVRAGAQFSGGRRDKGQETRAKSSEVQQQSASAVSSPAGSAIILSRLRRPRVQDQNSKQRTEPHGRHSTFDTVDGAVGCSNGPEAPPASMHMSYGRMAVEFLDPLGRGGKPSNIPVVFAD